MAQYIDKSALVAEIERRENICKKVVLDLRTEENKDYYQGKAEAYKETLDFLNILEVKKVDLDYIEEELIRIHKPDGDFGWGTLYNVATHFFELGLKAQKGE